MQYACHKILFTVGFMFLLVACGDDAFVSPGNSGKPANAETVINSFTATGARVDAGVEVVNTTEPFSLEWDVSSSSIYPFEVWLSDNAELGSADIKFFNGNCGPGNDCLGTLGDFDCNFVKSDTDTTLACNNAVNPVNVAAVLSGVSPGKITAYLILKANNQVGDQLNKVAFQKVTFEF